jgi:hypothetical protein
MLKIDQNCFIWMFCQFVLPKLLLRFTLIRTVTFEGRLDVLRPEIVSKSTKKINF